MTSNAKSMYRKLYEGKRSNYKVLAFPEDIDVRGNQNVIFLNINAVDGSRYAGKEHKQYTYVDGATPTYQQSDSGSLGRKMQGMTRRIDTSIALYIPNNIETNYSSNWDATNMDSAGAVLDAATGIGDLTGVQGWKQMWEAAKKAAPNALLNTVTGATQSLTGLNVQDAKNFTTRSVSNPYTEVIFNGVDNRTFSFTFKFIPKSEDEQATIKEIVDTLKFHRAPEVKYSEINNYWLFPSEFDITFLNKGRENEQLFKISTCALTNMSVNYGGDSYFATHTDGSPFFTEMTLEFLETEVLTKERMRQGY